MGTEYFSGRIRRVGFRGGIEILMDFCDGLMREGVCGFSVAVAADASDEGVLFLVGLQGELIVGCLREKVQGQFLRRVDGDSYEEGCVVDDDGKGVFFREWVGRSKYWENIVMMDMDICSLSLCGKVNGVEVDRSLQVGLLGDILRIVCSLLVECLTMLRGELEDGCCGEGEDSPLCLLTEEVI
jgi:hypothetical protein